MSHLWPRLTVLFLALLSCISTASQLAAAETEARPVKNEATAKATMSFDAAAIEQRLRDDLKILASDEYEGRGLNTEGLNKAADYIAAEFKRLGYQTDLFDGTPFQPFQVTTSHKLGRAEENKLSIISGDKTTQYKLGVEYNPLSLGGTSTFDYPLVFVGYGISAKDWKYDDYADVDVKDKAVIILRHEPQQRNDKSVFDGKKDSMYAPLMRKISNAYQHGAKAIIFVTDEVEIQEKVLAQRKQLLDNGKKLQAELAALEKANPELPAIQEQRAKLEKAAARVQKDVEELSKAFDPLLPFERGEPGDSRKMPILHVQRAVIDPLLKKDLGKSLSEIERAIDTDLKPRSAELPSFRVAGSVKIDRSEANIKNVIAVLPGSGPLAEETIIIGAHYDHLGRGEPGSLQAGSKEIHNGADDNGSGTVALLEVARRLASVEKRSRRIVVMAFTGEERGLLGSAHYIHNPVFPLNKTIAMLNMDMVGRLKDNKLTVYGTGTAKEFDGLITKLNEQPQYAFQIKREPSGFGPSDHSTFYAAKIPVFHLFTDLHNDYHRPSDDIDKINYEGIRRISEFCADIALEIDRTEKPPTFAETGGGRFGGGREKQGARPYFGSIPDLSSTAEGYALQAVAKDGPAEEGGLQGGDIIIGLAENKIGNLDDFDTALRKFKGGDTVEVTVLRGKQTVKLKVTLGQPK
jgi:hypothetical protein